jgi:hypothetical protein
VTTFKTLSFASFFRRIVKLKSLFGVLVGKKKITQHLAMLQWLQSQSVVEA